MGRSWPHPAIHRLRSKHAHTVGRLKHILNSGHSPPPPLKTIWKPKIPQVVWPPMVVESTLTQDQWLQTNFPSMPLPSEVTGVVNIEAWDAKISQLLEPEEVDQGLINLMKDIRSQLSNGASSHVGDPGTNLTQGINWFPDPPMQLPRVADALAYFAIAGHVAGPLFNLDKSQFKVNPLMAVKKPGDHVRVVGNLKSPPGQSFNDGIPEERLLDWPVTMLTAPKFAKMIINAGRNAFMACSDMKDAYKMIPVSLEQRNLQAYHFCGALFLELKLVFGDKLACQYFDKFHHVILQAFVYPISPFPPVAQGRTVDDIPSVVPANAKRTLLDFVSSYRSSLNQLNIQAAENDPTCTKAFDCSTCGEVLGIRFDTETFTWSLPHDKLYNLVTSVRDIAVDKSNHSLRELEIIMGRLNHVSQLCPPLKTYTSDATVMMADHIRELCDEEGKIGDKQRDSHKFHTTLDVRRDLLIVAALMADTYDHPLPIMDPDPPPPLCAVPIYTDASGHIGGSTSPSLGVFFPPYELQHAAAYSLPFPTEFLLKTNNSALVADTTSTLEALGVLVPMMIDPHRCVGKSLEVYIDNISVVYSFRKRRSNDRLAHTLIRAACLLSGALACRLFVTWVPRRSDQLSIIADDLTHMNFQSALLLDRRATTTTYQSFPPPISDWMKDPIYDRDLGHTIISWMSSYYNNLL